MLYLQGLISFALWTGTAGLMALIVYIQYEDVQVDGVRDHQWNTIQRTLYETLSRDAWALCLAWIVYACNQGCAGRQNVIKAVQVDRM